MKSRNLLKPYLMNIGKFFTIAAAFVFLTIAASQANAQSIDQCNPSSDPTCVWQNGNLGKGIYSEGQSVPYRIYYSGLAAGSHTVTITFGTSKAGSHAQDYLTTYNSSIAGANPCQAPAVCSGSPDSSFGVPANPYVTANCPTCAQTGNFTIWGGTITAASAYSLNGSYASDGDTSITLTFTSTSPNVVIAFAGHISSRIDWGFNTATAANIPGSPYHVDAGGHNCSMKASSIFFPALIKVTKAVNGATSVGGVSSQYTTSTDSFSFTSTNTEIGGFTLTDDYDNCAALNLTPEACTGATSDQQTAPSPTAIAPAVNNDWKIFTLNNVASPGASGTISEAGNSVSGLTQVGLSCTLGSGSPGTVDTATGSVVFSGFVQGSSATCTFINTRSNTTAATAVVTGRVTAGGRGVKGATVTATNFNGVQTVSVKTDAKGNFTFTKLETTDGYSFSASAKGYTFGDPVMFFPLGDSRVVDFTGTAAAPTKGGKNK